MQMVAFIRQFLVIFLVLLQYAAPLLHAHSGGDNQQNGLHLHEFELVRFNQNQQFLEKACFELNDNSNVVAIDSVIARSHATADLSGLVHPYAILAKIRVYLNAVQNLQLGREQLSVPLTKQAWLNKQYSRAPPLVV